MESAPFMTLRHGDAACFATLPLADVVVTATKSRATVWDKQSWQKLQTLDEAHTRSVTALASAGGLLATAGADSAIFLWRHSEKGSRFTPLAHVNLAAGALYCLLAQEADDGSGDILFFAGCQDTNAYVLRLRFPLSTDDLPSLIFAKRLVGATSFVYSLSTRRVSSTAETVEVTAGSGDGLLRIWRIDVSSLSSSSSSSSSETIPFAPSGEVTSAPTPVVVVAAAPPTTPLPPPLPQPSPMSKLAASLPSLRLKTILSSPGGEKAVASIQAAAVLQPGSAVVHADPNASSSSSSAASSSVPLPGGCGPVYALASAGKDLYCGCADGGIRVFDVQSRFLKYLLHGHTAEVMTLCLVADPSAPPLLPLSSSRPPASAASASASSSSSMLMKVASTSAMAVDGPDAIEHGFDESIVPQSTNSDSSKRHSSGGALGSSGGPSSSSSNVLPLRPSYSFLCSGDAAGALRVWSTRTYLCLRVIDFKAQLQLQVSSSTLSSSSSSSLAGAVGVWGASSSSESRPRSGSTASSSLASATVTAMDLSRFAVLSVSARNRLLLAATSDGTVSAYDTSSLALRDLAAAAAAASGASTEDHGDQYGIHHHGHHGQHHGHHHGPHGHHHHGVIGSAAYPPTHHQHHQHHHHHHAHNQNAGGGAAPPPPPHQPPVVAIAESLSGAGGAWSALGTNGVLLPSIASSSSLLGLDSAHSNNKGGSGGSSAGPATTTSAAGTANLLSSSAIGRAALQTYAKIEAFPVTSNATSSTSPTALPAEAEEDLGLQVSPKIVNNSSSSAASASSGNHLNSCSKAPQSRPRGLDIADLANSSNNNAADDDDDEDDDISPFSVGFGEEGESGPLSQQSLLERLRQLVAIPTISLHDGAQPRDVNACWRAARLLQDLIASFGGEARLVCGSPGANPTVLGRIGAWGAPAVLQHLHYDVQPAGDLSAWNDPPFVLTGKDGYLWGRGASDGKGPLLAMLFAAARAHKILEAKRERALRAHQKAKERLEQGLPASTRPLPKIPGKLAFIFLFEGEGENGSAGFREAVLQNLEWFSGTRVILNSNNTWLGEEVPCLTYGLRGLLKMKIEISGPSSDLHSGLDGGVCQEPLQDLCALLGSLVEPRTGKIAVEGLYDDVAPLSVEELRLYTQQDSKGGDASSAGAGGGAGGDFDAIRFMDARGLAGVYSTTNLAIVNSGSSSSAPAPAQAAKKAEPAVGEKRKERDAGGRKGEEGVKAEQHASKKARTDAEADGSRPHHHRGLSTISNAAAGGAGAGGGGAIPSALLATSSPLPPDAPELAPSSLHINIAGPHSASGSGSADVQSAGSTPSSAPAPDADKQAIEGGCRCTGVDISVEAAVLLRRWREPSLTVHGIVCSAANESIIPRSATAFVSIRTVPNMTSANTFKLVAQHLQRQLEARASVNTLSASLTAHASWWLQSPAAPHFQVAAKAILKHWGRPPLFVREGGTVRVTTFLERTLKAPALHLPLGQSSDSPHLPNERLRLLNLVKGLQVLESMFLEFAEASAAPSSSSASAATVTDGGSGSGAGSVIGTNAATSMAAGAAR